MLSGLKFCVVLEKYLLQPVPKASRDDESSPAQISPHDGALFVAFGKVCLCCSAITALPLQFLLSKTEKNGFIPLQQPFSCLMAIIPPSSLLWLCSMGVWMGSPAQEASLEVLYLLVGCLPFSQLTNNW